MLMVDERFGDFMYDALHDLSVGPISEGDAVSVWEGLRDLVGNLDLGDLDMDALYDEDPPEGSGEHVAIVFANLWDNEGFIAVVPNHELPDQLRDDLTRCNGQIFDDQSDSTDWDGFPAALRVAAACGGRGELESFTATYANTLEPWDAVADYARQNFGCLARYSIYPDGVFNPARLRQPLSACYALALGGS